MNAIRQTALLNKRELENATPPSASWHVDYRDTAWIYVGGLSLDLSEGDVVTIFSQFGNPTHLNLIREKDTGKSKGFGFLKYEDQRSCDLAVDNLGGADVLGRLLRIDHTRFKRKEGEDEETYRIDRLEAEGEEQKGNGKRASDAEESEDEGKRKKKRKLLKEERELEEMLAITQDGEEQDPMRDYLIREKREEVAKAKEKQERKHKHKNRHHHRRRDGDDDRERDDRSHHKHWQRNSSPNDHDEVRRKIDRDERDDQRPMRRRHDDGSDDDRRRRRSRSRDQDRGKYDRRPPRRSGSASEDNDRRQRDR